MFSGPLSHQHPLDVLWFCMCLLQHLWTLDQSEQLGGSGEITGVMMVCVLVCKNTPEMEFRRAWFRFSDGTPASSVMDSLTAQKRTTIMSHETLLFEIPRFRLCMMERPLLLFFDSSLLHYWRCIGSEADWWLGFLSSTPKDSGVLLHVNGTLVFNDCMEWANSAMGFMGRGYSPGLARSKDSFSFQVKCALRGHQKGLAIAEVIKELCFSRLILAQFDSIIHT
jgi:hypothetical protein